MQFSRKTWITLIAFAATVGALLLIEDAIAPPEYPEGRQWVVVTADPSPGR